MLGVAFLQTVAAENAIANNHQVLSNVVFAIIVHHRFGVELDTMQAIFL